VILSAGYIGSCLWGSFFILMSWSYVPTRIAASVFIVSAIATALVLRVKQRTLGGTRCCFGTALRVFQLLVALIVAALWVIEEVFKDDMTIHPLSWAVLVIGTVCTLHAAYDTIHDVFIKKIDNRDQGKSDAVMFAEEYGGLARCWGFLWSAFALAVIGVALFGLVALEGKCKSSA